MNFLEIQLFLSISVIVWIALKHWNLPLNLDFKIVAKFLLRSHFLSIYNNITIKKQINHEAIEKVSHLHNGICHSNNLCQFYSMISPVLFIKNNKLWYNSLKGNIELQKKAHRRIYLRKFIIFFGCTRSFLCHFLSLFCLPFSCVCSGFM